MTVRRQQAVILNVPMDVLAQNVGEVLRGNPLNRNIHVSEDCQTFTFNSAFTLTKVALRWSVHLAPDGSKTLVTVKNASLPFVVADAMNLQNRYIADFLAALQHVADQTLLRAASEPTAMAETLLRPADSGKETAAEELLRPDPSFSERAK